MRFHLTQSPVISLQISNVLSYLGHFFFKWPSALVCFPGGVLAMSGGGQAHIPVSTPTQPPLGSHHFCSMLSKSISVLSGELMSLPYRLYNLISVTTTWVAFEGHHHCCSGVQRHFTDVCKPGACDHSACKGQKTALLEQGARQTGEGTCKCYIKSQIHH